MRTGPGLQLVAAATFWSMLTLWPLQAGGEELDSDRLVSQENATARVATCRIDPDAAWYDPEKAGKIICEWHAALRSAVTSARSDWGYEAGLTLFVAGNAIAFSFPIWAALGADVVTITSVIITGEIVEVVGIFLLGEEALHYIRQNLSSIAAELRAQIVRLKSTRLPEWSWTPSWDWTRSWSWAPGCC